MIQHDGGGGIQLVIDWYCKWVSQIMGNLIYHREEADPTDNLKKKEIEKFRS